MRIAILLLIAVVGYQQYQIHELKLDHEDVGVQMDAANDYIGDLVDDTGKLDRRVYALEVR